jgi:hypothetical protein
VLALPLVGSFPDHPPEAVQLLALVEDQLSVADPPLPTVAGLALRLTVGFAPAALTVIANAGREAVATPSVTLITMAGSVPTSVAAGVPLSCPVAMLKFAHDGLPVIENVMPLPAGSLAVGVNEYAAPTAAFVPCVPEICGPATTTIVKPGRDALATPSLTLITIPE